MSQLDTAIESLGEVVPDAVTHLKAFLTYQGDNPKYYQKAKVAGTIVGAYVKAEATKTNRMAVEQASQRMKELQPA
jgi:hypothetical protein